MSTYDELLSSLDEENTWRADGIFLDLHEDLTSTATVRYDVASTIVDSASKSDREQHKLWFPPQYNEDSASVRELVVALCAKACIPVGFSLVTRTVEKQGAFRKIRLICSRGFLLRESGGGSNIIIFCTNFTLLISCSLVGVVTVHPPPNDPLTLRTSAPLYLASSFVMTTNVGSLESMAMGVYSICTTASSRLHMFMCRQNMCLVKSSCWCSNS